MQQHLYSFSPLKVASNSKILVQKHSKSLLVTPSPVMLGHDRRVGIALLREIAVLHPMIDRTYIGNRRHAELAGMHERAADSNGRYGSPHEATSHDVVVLPRDSFAGPNIPLMLEKLLIMSNQEG